MDPISAIASVGSLINVTRSVVNTVRPAKSSPAAYLARAAAPGQDFAARLIQALDTDKNGMLSITELQSAATLFPKIDADRNGQVSQTELSNYFLALRPSAAINPGVKS